MITPPKSAIQEARDQLFLNHAVNEYLTAVTTNLGIKRPKYGMANDDLWRAVVRRIALDTRQVLGVFVDVLTLLFGPRISVCTSLNVDALIDDFYLTLKDSERIPQLGTMIIDPGLPTEETIVYGFRDPYDHKVRISQIVTQDHVALKNNESQFLKVAASATDTLITLTNTEYFPVAPGTDIPLLIDAGSPNEELVLMSNNNTVTGELTVSPLLYDHPGLIMTPYAVGLLAVSPALEVLTLTETQNLPDKGFLEITEDGGATTETVEFVSVDFLAHQVYLKNPLVNVYAAATVTLLKTACSVQVAQVLVRGVPWDIFQTDPNHLQIFIPEILNVARLVDAWYLHDRIVGAIPTTTVAVNATAGDTDIFLALPVDTFPSAGILELDPAGPDEERISYSLIENFSSPLLASHGTGIPIGSTELFVENAQHIAEYLALTHNTNAMIDRGGADDAVVIESIDVARNIITLTALTPTTALHAEGTIFEIGDRRRFILSRPLVNNHVIGQTANLFRVQYPATTLESGQINSVDPERYQGKYSYAPLGLSYRNAYTTLVDELAGPQPLQVSQFAGNSVLEVADASRFNLGDFQDVRVSRGLAGDETVLIQGIYLKRNATGIQLTGGPYAPGDTVLTITPGAGIPDDPDNALGYRIYIDRFSATVGSLAEVVYVLYYNIATNTIILRDGLAYSHAATDNVFLLADLIKTDQLNFSHNGIYRDEHSTRLLPEICEDWDTRDTVSQNFNRVGSVEEVRSYINVVDHTPFLNLDQAILNFGTTQIPHQTELVSNFSATSLAVDVVNGAAFPAANFYVRIGKNTWNEEVHFVLARAGNTLIIPDGLFYNHRAFEIVELMGGNTEVISYSSASANRLHFSRGFTATRDHMAGETVMPKDLVMTPSPYGKDFAPYLLMTLLERYRWLFDEIRAAGVQVSIDEF